MMVFVQNKMTDSMRMTDQVQFSCQKSTRKGSLCCIPRSVAVICKVLHCCKDTKLVLLGIFWSFLSPSSLYSSYAPAFLHLGETLRTVDYSKVYLGLRHLRELLSHQEFFLKCVLVKQAQAASMFFVMKVSCHDTKTNCSGSYWRFN